MFPVNKKATGQLRKRLPASFFKGILCLIWSSRNEWWKTEWQWLCTKRKPRWVVNLNCNLRKHAFANAKNPSEVNFSDDRLTGIMITGTATVICRMCLKYCLQFTDIITIFFNSAWFMKKKILIFQSLKNPYIFALSVYYKRLNMNFKLLNQINTKYIEATTSVQYENT